MKKYMIGSSGDSHFQDCGAKTLIGAMRCARAHYLMGIGGKLQVAEVVNGQIIVVAVRYGFDKWQASL